MIVKDAEFKVCECCGTRQRTAGPVLGCDYCQTPILLERGLTITVFFKEGEAVDYHFCSWDCLLLKLPEIETDHFISLPYLSYDEDIPGQAVGGFWKAIKAMAERIA